jgi:DNA-binding GntR family transcriptional regulator
MKMSEFLTLKDHVYSYLTKKIMNGELEPNEKINENDIVKALSISRTPVREALIQLASEGLLHNVPRKGFVLNHVDEATAKELYAVIGLMEGYAAKLVMDLITEKELKDMDFYVSSMNLAIDSNNDEMYYQIQTQFHDVYLNLCDNKILLDTLAQMKKKFVRKVYKTEGINDMQKMLRITNKEHQEIVELFRAKKADELEMAVRHHWNVDLAYLEAI